MSWNKQQSCNLINLVCQKDVMAYQQRYNNISMLLWCFGYPVFSFYIFRHTSGNFEMKSWALASCAAASISCWVASFRPYRMFSLIVVPNRMGSCPTTPMWLRNQPTLSCDMSVPSSSTFPWDGSYSLCTRWSMVDLPHPELPTRATVSPLFTVSSRPCSTCKKKEWGKNNAFFVILYEIS